MSATELLAIVALMALVLAAGFVVWRRRRLAHRGNRPNIEHRG